MIEDLIREAIERNGTLKFRLKGTSMRPFLREGDILTVSALRSQKISVGDLVIYHDGMSITCHRVFRTFKNNFQLKADAAMTADEFLKKGRLMGKVVELQKGGLILNMNNNAGRIANMVISRASLVTALLYAALAKIRARRPCL